MRITSQVPGIAGKDVRRMLSGLPDAKGYEARQITLQVPEPFVPFGEVVPYAAKRRPGKGLKFIWLSEGVTFRTPREVLRFLYLHEWMHWYLKEVLGRRSAAETACDRFALHNYRRIRVSTDAADEALRRPRLTGLPASPGEV
jgi:hypothetical protein